MIVHFEARDDMGEREVEFGVGEARRGERERNRSVSHRVNRHDWRARGRQTETEMTQSSHDGIATSGGRSRKGERLV